MIALAGTIGTGLFLGSGAALANGGPVGFFLGYTIVGCLIGMMIYCLGEMSSCYPCPVLPCPIMSNGLVPE